MLGLAPSFHPDMIPEAIAWMALGLAAIALLVSLVRR